MASRLFLRGSVTSARALINPIRRVDSQALRTPLNLSQKRYTTSAKEMMPSLVSKAKSSMTESPLPWWLFGTAGLVATTLTVGAAAQLTRSGASMLYWKPRAWLPPKTESEWQEEFDAYGDFCARYQRSPMSLAEFKCNYKWEFTHRLLGQVTALTFAGPLVYMFAKNKLPIPTQGPLALVAALGAAQLYIGREMVLGNVAPDPEREEMYQPPAERATFQLPLHTAFSLGSFALLTWTGLGIISPASRAITLRELMVPSALKEIGDVRKYFQIATALLAGTVVMGATVTDIDAGHKYQTFPKMGDRWIPKGLFEQKPWLRNFHDNPALVQFNHRLIGFGTLAAYTAVILKARKPNVWTNLPEDAKRAMMLTLAAATGEVILGATMLVNEVPTSLTMVHEATATLVLGSSLWALHTLRFARPGGILGAVILATQAAKAV